MSTNGPRILVIDDDTRITRLISEYLVGNGWTVAVEPTGEAGLARTATERFDAVLVDLGLPGMDGLAVVRSLRRASKDAPVIVITGAATADNAIRALRHGATDFLQKPFHLKTLQDALDRVTAGRQRAESVCAAASVSMNGGPGLHESLSTVVSLLDSQSDGHDVPVPDARTEDAERLVVASGVVGEALALAPNDLRRLRWAARVSALPAETLAGLVAIGEAARLAQSAAERWDGTGQPRGVRADAIPLLSRCIAVARSLAEAANGHASPSEIRAALKSGAGRAFDPSIVAACAALTDDALVAAAQSPANLAAATS